MRLCQCGCGQPTKRIGRQRPQPGDTEANYRPFRKGHSSRKPGHLVCEDRGHDSPCLMWQLAKSIGGYGVKRLSSPRRMIYAHRWYWEQVHGPVTDGHDLHHRCEQRACCNVEHLQLVTRLDHERIHSKLTPEAVREIRRMLREGDLSQTEIGRRFGVNQSSVSSIRYGRHWAGVE